MKDLSVIIVNYNVKHFLEQCLVSVQKAIGDLDVEVWVVDNNSVDGSQQMVAQKFPWVKLIANKDNVGFSTANNQAIRESEGRYVLLLNPDTIVEEETFAKTVAFMDEHPDGGALGVKMLDGKGKFLPESKRGLPTPSVSFYKIFGLWKLFPKNKKFGWYYLSHLDKEKNHEVEVLSGAFMLLRKSVLDEIGLLDETFFMYGEDIDLSYRVIKGGYKNYYVADTQIIHYKGESTKKSTFNYVRVFYNAMIIFAKKHFNKGQLRLYVFLIQAAVYFRALVALITRIFKSFQFPLVEGALIYGAIYGIKEYWEFRIPFLKGDMGNHQYPPEFDQIAAPIYTLIFLFFLWSFGAYRRPFKIKPILTAGVSSFVAIAVVSYIWKDINFSRAIVGLSSIATIFIGLITRGIVNFKEAGNFFFTEETKRQAIIVADESEADRIGQLIRGELNYPVNVLGLVSPNENNTHDSGRFLGNMAQLVEIINYYRIEEVIFANQSVPTNKIIELMGGISAEQVEYKIVPPNAEYLVGPQVIHSSPYAVKAFFNLEKKGLRFKKRLFDIIGSAGLILLYPLIFWLYRHPLQAFRNLWNVLRGEYHLVGYIRSNPEGLPELKNGLLNMMDRVRKKMPASGGDYSLGLDRHYATSYSIELDFEILFKGIRNLGKFKRS